MEENILGNSILFMILLQVALIGLNAIFACAETAIISMNDMKMEKMAAEGNKKAKKLVRLTAEPARFLSTIQIAITLSGFLGSAFAAENFSGISQGGKGKVAAFTSAVLFLLSIFLIPVLKLIPNGVISSVLIFVGILMIHTFFDFVKRNFINPLFFP